MKLRSCLIICTLNRPTLTAGLATTIQSFLDCPSKIIIVDASHDQAHDELVSNIAYRADLSIVRSAAGLPRQRNTALRLMNPDTDFVHFLDDDVEIVQGYFETLEKLFCEFPTVGGIGVRTADVPEGLGSHSTERALRRFFLLDSPVPGKLLKSGINTPFWEADSEYSVDWLPGCAMSFRAAAISGLEFDEGRSGVGWGEDVDFSYRVSQRRPIIITSRTRVFHHKSDAERDSELVRRVSETNSRLRMAGDPIFPVSVAGVKWSLFGATLIETLSHVRASTRALTGSLIRLLNTYRVYRNKLPVTDEPAKVSVTKTPDSRSPFAELSMPTSAVWVELQGGLGNQLFGYAAGRALARRLNSPLSLSVATFGPDSPRKPSLGFLHAGRSVGEAPNTLPIFEEASFAFDPRWSSLNEPHLLRGYFQSEKYFAEIQEEVSDELRTAIYSSLANPPSEDGPYLALQVRRGDYLREPAFSYHGLCSQDYYLNAVKLLRDFLGPLPVMILGDEPSYCIMLSKKIENALTIRSQPDGESVLRDLWLLSRASGAAISNSSFGWWGAYLNSCSAPVVAPRPWFSNSLVNTRTLLPQKWITLGR